MEEFKEFHRTFYRKSRRDLIFRRLSVKAMMMMMDISV